MNWVKGQLEVVAKTPSGKAPFPGKNLVSLVDDIFMNSQNIYLDEAVTKCAQPHQKKKKKNAHVRTHIHYGLTHFRIGACTRPTSRPMQTFAW